jgi:hypothetical protein
MRIRVDEKSPFGPGDFPQGERPRCTSGEFVPARTKKSYVVTRFFLSRTSSLLPTAYSSRYRAPEEAAGKDSGEEAVAALNTPTLSGGKYDQGRRSPSGQAAISPNS